MSLKSAYNLAAGLTLTVFLLVGFSTYKAFSRWRASEVLSSCSREVVLLSSDLLLLSEEHGIADWSLRQWNLTMNEMIENISRLSVSYGDAATEKLKRFIFWSDEIIILIRQAETQSLRQVYRQSLSMVVQNLSSELRILHGVHAVENRKTVMNNALLTLLFSCLSLFTVISASGLYIYLNILDPLNEMVRIVETCGTGGKGERMPISGILELETLADSFNITMNRLDSAAEHLELEVKKRTRAEKEIRRRFEEKEILLKETHHRIKNNIASIGSLLSLHAASAADPEAVSAIREAQSRVNSMGVLYERMLITEEYEILEADDYLSNLSDSIILLFPGNTEITLEKNSVNSVSAPNSFSQWESY